VTLVEGLEGEKLEETASELKHKRACGGTAK
jgi:translation initiation factor 1 (eIF-1/SUI1)